MFSTRIDVNYLILGDYIFEKPPHNIGLEIDAYGT
jgi:hypothetical protein